jgi:hypothetical protein
VVPDVLLVSVAIVVQEITSPFATIVGVDGPHEVKARIEISAAEINFIENPHLFSIAPWL